MPIWTTTQLNEVLMIRELPLRILPANEVKAGFLAQAVPGDIAIIGIDDDYLRFLSEAEEKGIPGPILLISPEPTMVETDLHRYNALVLDLKKMGKTVVRNIVHVILGLAARQGGFISGIAFDAGPAQRSEEKPIDDPAVIRERLAYIHRKGFPVTLAVEVREGCEPVIARGSCTMKEVRDDGIVFHNFKQSLLFRGMKKSDAIKIFFSYKQVNHEINVVIQKITDREITTTVPAKLFNSKDIRIQPNENKPVSLYMLIPNEPTTDYKVIDISPRGLGFLCTRDLPMNGAYSFTIVLPDPRAVVVTGGIIRFKKECTGGIRYGVEIKPHPWDEESIVKYIMKRETEIIGLLRNL